MANDWSTVVKAFAKVDSMFDNDSYFQAGWTLNKKLRVASAILLLAALSEHIMVWVSFLYDRYMQVVLCNWEIGSTFYYIATTHLAQVYAKLPVNPYTVIWAEYMNLSFTFAWSFADLFIVLMSISIASKFERINKRLEFFRERVSASTFKNKFLLIFFSASAIIFGKRFVFITIKCASYMNLLMIKLELSCAL